MVLLLAMLAVPAFASADMFFTLGVQNSKLNLNMKFPEGGGMSTQFDMQALAEFTSVFNRGYGFKALFGTDFKSGFQLGTAFAYADNINSNVSYILSVGPTFSFGGFSVSENTKGSTFAIGANIDAAFQFYLTSDLYVDVATGLMVDIVSIQNGKAETNISLFIPLPRVGLGWKF